MKELFDNCDDKTYGRFLNFVRRGESRCYEIYNIGTILDRVYKYARFEQIFSAGIDDIIDTRKVFKYTIKDIPKALIKICKQHDVKISNKFLEYYKENPDAFQLPYKMEFISLTDADIYKVLTKEKSWRDEHYDYHYFSVFNTLLKDYGYTAKALWLYIDELMTLEALEDTGYVIDELYDYAVMMKKISTKFDKYPRNFLTSHRIASRNYRRMIQEFKEEDFKKRIDKSLEFTYKGWTFIYPEKTQDIKDEAAQQNNCVASYIDNVIDGNCHILFMRKKDDPEHSIVTIEVRDNRIVQARGKFNRECTQEEKLIIEKWNRIHKVEKKDEVAA